MCFNPAAHAADLAITGVSRWPSGLGPDITNDENWFRYPGDVEKCKKSGMYSGAYYVERVQPDGLYFLSHNPGPYEAEHKQVIAWMNAQFRAYPYLDWLKARQAASAPKPSGSVATIPSPAGTPSAAGPVIAPVWREWKYAYKFTNDGHGGHRIEHK